MKWQPIETAPMNGTDVLLYEKGSLRAVMGYWYEDPNNRGLSSWWVEGGQCTASPTHWMPLPNPPEEVV
jgi:hypothetical protein